MLVASLGAASAVAMALQASVPQSARALDSGAEQGTSSGADMVFPDEAVKQARELGQRVEITALRTESETVYANPSGTRTLETSAVPVRTRKDGRWARIDTTLVRTAEGTIEPVATSMSMEFSAGGTEPLARIQSGPTTMELTFPKPLPEPTLSGNEARYAEVFPGVDLVVRAEPDTFSHVLVVKNAQAAASPALRELRFGVSTPGSTVRAKGAGLEIVGPDGTPEILSPEPMMWDSRGLEAAAERRLRPMDGDRVRGIGTEVSAGELVLRPNQDLLTGPDVEFPIYIDPTWGPVKSAWAMVYKEFPNMEFYKWATGTNGEGVGYQTFNGVSTKRLFWNFPVSKIAGTRILDATFSAYEVYAASCTATRLDLYRTGLVNSGTNWSNQPAWNELVDSRTVAFGRDGCDPNGRLVEFNAKPAAVDASHGRYTKLGLGLRAYAEGNNLSWKRFRNDAKLSITYNSYPNPPSGVVTVFPSTKCVSGSGRPVIPLDPPRLSVNLSDPDTAQLMRAEFQLYSGGTLIWDPPPTAYRAPRDADGRSVPYRIDVPESRIDDGGTFMWKVRGQDRLEDGTEGNYSDWSANCEFTVDITKPNPPTITAAESNEYAVGNQVSFTFGPNESTDVGSYKWSLNTDAVNNTVSASSPTITPTLTAFGPSALWVQAVDKAGNLSGDKAKYEFYTAGGGPLAVFALDEGSGTITADTLNPSRTMTIASSGITWEQRNPDWDPGDWTLNFGGANSAWSSFTGLVRTENNYSISAWIRPAEVAGDRTAVGQDGPGGSSFMLGIDNNCVKDGVTLEHCYAFRVTSATGEVASAVSPSLPNWGEWAHLVGVYKAGSDELELYIEMELLGTAVVPFSAPASTGQLRFGRSTDPDGSPPTNYYAGYLDDVRIYTGALDQSQVNTDWAEQP